MASEVVMPRLGWNMEVGRLVEWLKQGGQYVEAGEPLLTVETDKVVQEVEALERGILYIPPGSPSPGQEIPVGTLLGYLLAEGETPPAGSGTVVEPVLPATSAATGTLTTTEGPRAAAPPSSPSAPAISPRARRIAAELQIDWTVLQASGWSGRISERDVRQAAMRAGAQQSPTTERTGLPSRQVAVATGTNMDLPDSQTHARRTERAGAEAAAEVPEVTISDATAMSALRRVTAERMAASAHTVAGVTLTTEVDATALVRLRNELKEDTAERSGPVPSYTDLLVKLSAQALLEHPAINARFDGDTIMRSKAAHIGIAVDTDRGLLVPVVRDVETKSLRRIAIEAAALIERARAGRLAVDEMSGGTFTITNLGMFGIDTFTPLINLPECAILGVGRIIPKPVVVDVEAERVAVRHMLFLSLTFDHRLVDGGPAARFLQRITQYIVRPTLWLAG